MKYMVSAITGPFGEPATMPYKSNNPEEAILKWCKLQKDYPTCVSLQAATMEDGLELLKWAQMNFNTVRTYMKDNKCPYKTDWIKDHIDRYVHRRKCSIQWEYDQLFPFSMG